MRAAAEGGEEQEEEGRRGHVHLTNGLAWGLHAEKVAVEKASERRDARQKEQAQRRERSVGAQSGPAGDSLLPQQIDVDQAQDVLVSERLERRGEEGEREGILCLEVESAIGSGQGRPRTSSRRRGVIYSDEQLRVQQQRMLRLSRKEMKGQ